MRWEFDIVFRVWRIALLKRIDEAMTKTSKRWAIGVQKSYLCVDGNYRLSWSVWKELK